MFGSYRVFLMTSKWVIWLVFLAFLDSQDHGFCVYDSKTKRYIDHGFCVDDSKNQLHNQLLL